MRGAWWPSCSSQTLPDAPTQPFPEFFAMPAPWRGGFWLREGEREEARKKKGGEVKAFVVRAVQGAWRPPQRIRGYKLQTHDKQKKKRKTRETIIRGVCRIKLRECGCIATTRRPPRQPFRKKANGLKKTTGGRRYAQLSRHGHAAAKTFNGERVRP